MSYVQFLLALARQLGSRLPEAWPYIVGIMQNLKKIYQIISGEPLNPVSLGTTATSFETTPGKKGKKGKKHVAQGPEVNELLNLAQTHGIPTNAMQEVADTFGGIQSAAKAPAKKSKVFKSEDDEA